MTKKESELFRVIGTYWENMDNDKRNYGFDIEDVMDWTGWGAYGSKYGVITAYNLLEGLYKKGRLTRQMEKKDVFGFQTWRYRIRD